MINFLKKPKEKIFNLKNLDRETLLFRVFPRFVMEIIRKYFRLTVSGAENIPRRGPVLFTPNHSGYSGFDAFVLAHVIQTEGGRIPRVLTHYFWFLTKGTAIPAQKLGFVEASTENGIKFLNKSNAVVLFPEGEHGNFKPTTDMYQLQEFKRGFVRMALKTGAPIVPTLVIGAEETHINLSQLKFTKYLKGLVLPIPLNVLPLPVKWKVVFMEPISLPYSEEAADDIELVHEIAQDIQEKMQIRLKQEIALRDSIFF